MRRRWLRTECASWSRLEKTPLSVLPWPHPHLTVRLHFFLSFLQTRSHKSKGAGAKAKKRGAEGKQGSNLGRSIIRQQFSTKIVSEKAIVETERGKSKLRSVTQCDDLEELMSNAVLAGTDFKSQRGEMIIVGSEASQEVERVRAPEGTEVPIPRRPSWRDVSSAEELEQNERLAFLEWRRSMAEMEEVQGYLLTPYEKNLEVWRQLWRVLERARLIVQIVDARNPLLFRCADLEAYVRELDPSKRCILLINKADLLTEAQRVAWAAHFKKAGLSFVFWSAAAAQEALDEEARRERAAWIDPKLRAHMKAQAALKGNPPQRKAAVDISDAHGDAPQTSASQAAGRRKPKGRGAASYEPNYAAGGSGTAAASSAASSVAAAPDVATADKKGGSGSESTSEEEEEDEDAMLLRMAGRANASAAAIKASTTDLLPADDNDDDDDEEEEEEGEDEDKDQDGGGDNDDDDDDDGWETDEETTFGVASASIATSAKTGATHVHSREELLQLLERMCPPAPKGTSAAGIDGLRSCVGMVGYPNVGKSSTVNVLVAAKKTNVSSTPGKTKHFQTLSVPDNPNMILCDCPGLVFPTVAGSKAQMVCDGILPIDQMKSDYLSPVKLLCERLPPSAFEQCYALKLRTEEERAEDVDMHEIEHELLTAHALARGFMTSTKGTPDESRSARVILKDFVNAKLLHTVGPPGAATNVKRLFGPRGGMPGAGEAGGAGGAGGAGDVGSGTCEGRKLPSMPTTARWLGQMKADYDAQEGVGAHFAKGRKKAGNSKHDQRMRSTVQGYQANPAATMRAAQWRPAGESSVPDRVVAAGPRVETARQA